MKYLKSLVIVSFILIANKSLADNGIATAVATSLTSQVVATGSAVYMKKNGMNPQIISTPYGAYAVPENNTTAPTPQTSKPQAPTTQQSAYEIQNQQKNKVEFLNGNVVEAFPQLPPAATSGH